MTNPREFFTRFATAVNARDGATVAAMLHPEFTAWTPQSGERSRGFDEFWAQLETYPGGAPDMQLMPETRLLGDDDRWMITPSYTVVPMTKPNEFTLIDRTVYPDGVEWHAVALVELRHDLLYRVELYFAPKMPAPLAASIAAYSHG